MRLVALSEASAGFAFISLTVTYLLTVTNALERKRTVALSFYHQAERGTDAAGFLIHHFWRGEFQGLKGIFANAVRDLQSLLESHVEYPVIHYFHPADVHKSLPRMLFLRLENHGSSGGGFYAREHQIGPEGRRQKARTFTRRSFHSLRHTCNSELANADVPQEVRRKLVGHMDNEINDIYTPLEKRVFRAAIHTLT